MNDTVGKFLGENIVPLDALSAPLVGEMQQVIRAQNELLVEADEAIRYFLGRKKEHVDLHYHMHATESESRLVTVLAKINNQARRPLADAYDAFHHTKAYYGCIDDPAGEAEDE